MASPLATVDEAKRRLAPHQPPSAWAAPDGARAFRAVARGTRTVALQSRRHLPSGGEKKPGGGREDDGSGGGGAVGGGGASGWVEARAFVDDTPRVPISSVRSAWGDDLPRGPCVLTHVCDAWPAFGAAGETSDAAVACGDGRGDGRGGGDGSGGGGGSARGSGSRRWGCVGALAALAPEGFAYSVDGGPGFARASYGEGRVGMEEYARYAASDADGDCVPLYVFDHRCLAPPPPKPPQPPPSPQQPQQPQPQLQAQPARALPERAPLALDFSVPRCFGRDAMACLTGTRFRPLPPAWLLVGAGGRSGTPIHDHPATCAWNALLCGCKLWCCLPPDVDESYLLLNSASEKAEEESETDGRGDDVGDDGGGDGGEGAEGTEDFDLSAVQWFGRVPLPLPDGCKVVVQRPGETVFVPCGWWHVVVNADCEAEAEAEDEGSAEANARAPPSPSGRVHLGKADDARAGGRRLADARMRSCSVALSHSLALRRDLPLVLPLLAGEDPDFARAWLDGLLLDQRLAVRPDGGTSASGADCEEGAIDGDGRQGSQASTRAARDATRGGAAACASEVGAGEEDPCWWVGPAAGSLAGQGLISPGGRRAVIDLPAPLLELRAALGES